MANSQRPPSKLKVVEGSETEQTAGTGEQPAGGDDLDVGALDQALTQFAAEQRPLLRRSDTARNKVAQRAREVETELNDLGAREGVLDRLYEAAKLGIADQRQDLTDELNLYQHGLVNAGSRRSNDASD
jgi:hypothetical protein